MQEKFVPVLLQVLNSRVQRVDAGSVSVLDKEDNETIINFGACVWATGVAMNPLVRKLQDIMPEQNHFRALLTDEKLRVLGSSGSMWAIGDAASIAEPRALDYADELFELADTDGNGALSMAELRVRVSESSCAWRALQAYPGLMPCTDAIFVGFSHVTLESLRPWSARSTTLVTCFHTTYIVSTHHIRGLSCTCGCRVEHCSFHSVSCRNAVC